MYNTETDPAKTPAFATLLADGHDVFHALISAEALIDLMNDMKAAHGAACFELPMGQFEIAVGDTTLPPLVAQMAGFEQAANGRWYSGEGNDSVLLEIPENLLAKYLRGLAEHI